jgi:replicative DNA helicase
MEDVRLRKYLNTTIPQAVKGATKLANLPIWIDDSSLTVEDLERRVHIAKRKHGVKFVVVDYIGLLTTKQRLRDSYERTTYISKQLKRIAKETRLPFLVLSQLSRKLEDRPYKDLGRSPIMSDFRDSGQIEQDAEGILAIYRDEVYNEFSQYKGKAHIIVLKNKNGNIGKGLINFDKQSMRFY